MRKIVALLQALYQVKFDETSHKINLLNINLLSYLFRRCCDGGVVRQHERRDDLVHGRRHPDGSLSVSCGYISPYFLFEAKFHEFFYLTLTICPVNVLTFEHATSNLATYSLSIKISKSLWVSAHKKR